MRNYHLMTACIIILTAEAFASAPKTLADGQSTGLPHRSDVVQFLDRSQLQPHIKDVLRNVLLNAKYVNSYFDFNFPGKDLPADWHFHPKTRTVYSHLSFATGTMTLHPGFLTLPKQEQVHLLIHMGLHYMQGLGISRIDENEVRKLSDMLERDQTLKDKDERRKMRNELRAFLDQRWTLKDGTLGHEIPDQEVRKPWPFDNGKWEPRGK